ncbi:putative nuclease HARBI1 isoform X1 [Drosophila takahashii]|uniref:putative nuclease HARBI1 isoform X1 n=1 Tax=Drosophila takahashii TaxID=29030 RepID=UPI001CF8E80C|nr:putative nuclease HARBI1 isoform X1 [Drosophila takahashii]
MDKKDIEALLIAVADHYDKTMVRLMSLAGMSIESFRNFRSRPSRSVWTLPRFGTFWEQDVPNNSEEFFKEHFRLEKRTFDTLVERLPNLRKKDTPFRMAIPLEKRIAIALYTLGSSAEYRTIACLFGVSKPIVCRILHEFTREVIVKLAPEYLPPVFLTQEAILENVKGFEDMGFPQCFGAIDGCHIEVRPHAKDAVDYHNYKGWYSTVLFAMVDYRYRFSYISVGSPGRCHDSKIFENSNLKRIIEESELMDEHSRIINDVEVPVLILGDSAFRFSKNLMKPYPFSVEANEEQKAFNYNLSKTRRVVENAFGHLKARFRRIGKGLDNRVEKSSQIISCCCILHNFCIAHNSFVPESWQQDAELVQRQDTPEHELWLGNTNERAETIRRALAMEFLNRNA